MCLAAIFYFALATAHGAPEKPRTFQGEVAAMNSASAQRERASLVTLRQGLREEESALRTDHDVLDAARTEYSFMLGRVLGQQLRLLDFLDSSLNGTLTDGETRMAHTLQGTTLRRLAELGEEALTAPHFSELWKGLAETYDLAATGNAPTRQERGPWLRRRVEGVRSRAATTPRPSARAPQRAARLGSTAVPQNDVRISGLREPLDGRRDGH